MAKQEIEEFVKSRPPLFWWLLANILAIAFAITSWVICLNLFRDPTNAKSYQLMIKVGRLDPLEKFIPTSAPKPRRTADPPELEAEFERFKNEDLQALNHELLRAYVTNYDKSEFLTYVKGEFKILSTRTLTDEDFLPSGIVVKAQAQVGTFLPQRPSPVGRLILRNWKRNSSALKMKTSRLSTTSYFGLTSLIMTNRSSSLT